MSKAEHQLSGHALTIFTSTPREWLIWSILIWAQCIMLHWVTHTLPTLPWEPTPHPLTITTGSQTQSRLPK
jgi:hypothetical protein